MDYQKLYPIFGIGAHGAFYNWWIFTQYGNKRIVKKYYYPENPRSADQQSNRALMYDAVKNWQGFDESTKNFYNVGFFNPHMSGYNRYISLYLEANKNMIIHWDTLKKNADDPAKIPDYIASPYFGPACYPASVNKLLGLGPSGDLVLPKNLKIVDGKVVSPIFDGSGEELTAVPQGVVPIVFGTQSAIIPLSSTEYIGPNQYGVTTVPTDANGVITEAGTLGNIKARIGNTQSATGDIDFNIKYGTNIVLTLTIPAGSSAGNYSNTEDTYHITAGLIRIEINNKATANSAQVVWLGCTFTPDSP